MTLLTGLLNIYIHTFFNKNTINFVEPQYSQKIFIFSLEIFVKYYYHLEVYNIQKKAFFQSCSFVKYMQEQN